MNSARPRRLAPPLPWHLLVWPLTPVLALLGTNLGFVPARAAIVPALLALGAALGVCALLVAVTRDLRRAALATSFLVVVFLSQSDISALARRIDLPPIIVSGPFPMLLVCGFILQMRRRIEMLTAFANASALVLAALMLMPIASHLVQRWRSPTNVFDPLAVARGAPEVKPDVFVLVLDGYGRADVLRDYFGFDNDLPATLRSSGFAVADKASSNYSQTAQSLSSLLNLEYLPTLLARQPPNVAPRLRFADFIARNRAFRTLEAAGYRIRAYTSEYGFVRPAEVHERPGPWLSLNDFTLALYGQSMVPLLSVLANYPSGEAMKAVHRHQVRWTLDHLANELPATDDPPTLVFAHVLMPHPPFAFDADGSALDSRLPATLDDGSHWKAMAQATSPAERYEAGYVSGIRFLNAQIAVVVNRIVHRPDRRPALIYIQGDHGPGSRLDWNDPGKTDFRERLGILLAMHPGGSERISLPEAITPVNAMRLLLNRVAGTGLDLLEDRSFFSPWTEPHTFIDVTDRVH